MKHYTVFDPDDGSGLTYRWHGGLTVNVYAESPGDLVADYGQSFPHEVDVFTMGHGPEGYPTDFGTYLDYVEDSITKHHARQILTEVTDEDDDEPSFWYVEGYSAARYNTVSPAPLGDAPDALYEWRSGYEAGMNRRRAEV